jgi:hypothetical protein
MYTDSDPPHRPPRTKDQTIQDDILPTIVQGIIAHVHLEYAEEMWWAYCAKYGHITVYEEARLKRVARHRLERYITRKLKEQRCADDRERSGTHG